MRKTKRATSKLDSEKYCKYITGAVNFIPDLNIYAVDGLQMERILSQLPDAAVFSGSNFCVSVLGKGVNKKHSCVNLTVTNNKIPMVNVFFTKVIVRNQDGGGEFSWKLSNPDVIVMTKRQETER